MNNGLDIESLRCVLALHAVLHSRPTVLVKLITQLSVAGAQCSSASLHRRTRKMASKWGIELDWDSAERGLRWLGDGGQLITSADHGYPSLLKELSNAPPVLFLRGEANQLAQPQLAIVGSRNATPGGVENAQTLASELGAVGFAITSGLARGIDAAAHRGALSVNGVTIAVSGTGIDQIYPRANARLAEQILAQGGIILSELPLGTPPLSHNFPRRNRIICGLAAGTIVVEAALNSGSLITAREALELGREVCAVPGAIRNPLARGCHLLLRQGATLVESAADVLAALPTFRLPRDPGVLPGISSQKRLENAYVSPDKAHARVLDCCAFEPTSIDALLQSTGLTMNFLSSILLTLELAGVIRSLPGGYVERTG